MITGADGQDRGRYPGYMVAMTSRRFDRFGWRVSEAELTRRLPNSSTTRGRNGTGTLRPTGDLARRRCAVGAACLYLIPRIPVANGATRPRQDDLAIWALLLGPASRRGDLFLVGRVSPSLLGLPPSAGNNHESPPVPSPQSANACLVGRRTVDQIARHNLPADPDSVRSKWRLYFLGFLSLVTDVAGLYATHVQTETLGDPAARLARPVEPHAAAGRPTWTDIRWRPAATGGGCSFRAPATRSPGLRRDLTENSGAPLSFFHAHPPGTSCPAPRDMEATDDVRPGSSRGSTRSSTAGGPHPLPDQLEVEPDRLLHPAGPLRGPLLPESVDER